MTVEQVPFGRALFESLGRLHGGEILTRRMKYGDIQELKNANREQTLGLFAGSSFEVLQRIKKDSPEELAEFRVNQADETDERTKKLLVFAAVLLLD